MKKLFLTSSIALSIICPAFADNPDIGASASTANCDSGVLHSTTGPTAFQAEWAANTININWYNDADAQSPISLTNSAAGTCTYDGAITLPTNTLSKTGYTFAGWQVRAPQCFAGVDVNINKRDDGIADGPYYWRNHDGSCEGYDGHKWSENCTDSDANFYANFSELTPGEWKVQFSYGLVRGIASCNSEDFYEEDRETPNSQVMSILANFDLSTEDGYNNFFATLYAPEGLFVRPANTFNKNSTGIGCWCRVTSFTPTNGETCTPTTSVWGYAIDSNGLTDSTDCAERCAYLCADTVSRGGSMGYGSSYRRALYGLN